MDTTKAAIAAAVQDQLINDEFWAPVATSTDGINRVSAARSSARETQIRVVPQTGHVRYFMVKVTEML